MSQSKYIPEWSSEIAKMPQGTGTTVKEVAGVDPEVKTNIREVDFLARSVIQVRLKLKCLSLLFAQLFITLNKPSRRSFLILTYQGVICWAG